MVLSRHEINCSRYTALTQHPTILCVLSCIFGCFIFTFLYTTFLPLGSICSLHVSSKSAMNYFAQYHVSYRELTTHLSPWSCRCRQLRWDHLLQTWYNATKNGFAAPRYTTMGWTTPMKQFYRDLNWGICELQFLSFSLPVDLTGYLFNKQLKGIYSRRYGDSRMSFKQIFELKRCCCRCNLNCQRTWYVLNWMHLTIKSNDVSKFSVDS